MFSNLRKLLLSLYKQTELFQMFGFLAKTELLILSLLLNTV